MKGILESFFLGLVTMMIGKSIHYIALKNLDKYERDAYKKTKVMDLCFFVIGLIMHLLLENCGFNSWYCQKCDNSCFKRIVSLNLKTNR